KNILKLINSIYFNQFIFNNIKNININDIYYKNKKIKIKHKYNKNYYIYINQQNINNKTYSYFINNSNNQIFIHKWNAGGKKNNNHYSKQNFIKQKSKLSLIKDKDNI